MSVNRIELCMQAAGYETAIKNGRQCSVPLESTGSKQVTAEYIQTISPICYQPMAWMSKRVFWFERLTGQVS